jgi:hypothetical protein
VVSIFILLFEEFPKSGLIEWLQLLENPFTFGDITIARFSKGDTQRLILFSGKDVPDQPRMGLDLFLRLP